MEERWIERGTELERIIFSDAVFAIAITLLVLEIRVPEAPYLLKLLREGTRASLARSCENPRKYRPHRPHRR